MKRQIDSLRGPHTQEGDGRERKAKRSTEAIDPVLKILEEKRKERRLTEEEREIKVDNLEIKTKEDEDEVISLCKKIFEVHGKCNSLVQINQNILDDINSKLTKLSINVNK